MIRSIHDGEVCDGTESVVIVHDYLTQLGGAERVVMAMSRVFPDAPILTSMYEADATFPDFAGCSIRTLPTQRLRILRQHHRLALPLYPFVFARQRVGARVVICSTSGWAHGVKTDGAKLLYVHNPARWLYQADEYLVGSPAWLKMGMRAMNRSLRNWNLQAAHSADRVLANSVTVRDRIRRVWDIDATVVYPPHGVDPNGVREPVCGLEPGYLLCVARLLPYKNVDVVLAAMSRLPNDRLVIVGGGPLWPRLKSFASSRVMFLDSVSDSQMRWLYENARLLVAAAFEDFGLTPVEAMAFGTPTVALRKFGYLESVVEGETGVFFDHVDPNAIIEAVRIADGERWSQDRLRSRAERFSESSFADAMLGIVSGVASVHASNVVTEGSGGSNTGTRSTFTPG